MEPHFDDIDAALNIDGVLDDPFFAECGDDLHDELVRNYSSASDALTVFATSPTMSKVRVKAYCNFNKHIVELW